MSAPSRTPLTRSLRRAARPAGRAVRRFRRRRLFRQALGKIGNARGVRLVLVYHRVAEPSEVPASPVVPTVPPDLFWEQLQALGELADVVPLEELVREPADPGGRLRLALTFDDDLGTHVTHVLPPLRELGLHATFFLSGRALHGLGGYWFERLEALLAERGPAETARLLDLPGVPEAELPLRCEADPTRLALIEREAPPVETSLAADGIRDLVEAGMAVGFHTLHHPVLPALGDAALRDALVAGRADLASLVGSALSRFAYPHGKTDERTIALTRGAGFSAALTTQPRVLDPTDDPYRLGRWEPRPVATDELLIRLGDVVRRAA